MRPLTPQEQLTIERARWEQGRLRLPTHAEIRARHAKPAPARDDDGDTVYTITEVTP